MMKRLIAAIKWDVLLQAKYGLYAAGSVVTIMWISILYFLPDESMAYAIPMVLFGDLAVVGYLFIAAMMYFEKGQGSIEAVIVTPLREREYIIAKLASILVYVIGTTIIMILFLSIFKTFEVHLLVLILGAIFISLFFTELGFLLSSKYKTFTDFLLPTSLLLMILTIPIIDFFGFTANSSFRFIFYLWPTYGQLKILQSGFTHMNPLDIAYGFIYNGIFIFLMFNQCIKVFNTSMIGRKGELK